jgi:hypothetical protein
MNLEGEQQSNLTCSFMVSRIYLVLFYVKQRKLGWSEHVERMVEIYISEPERQHFLVGTPVPPDDNVSGRA